MQIILTYYNKEIKFFELFFATRSKILKRSESPPETYILNSLSILFLI